MRSPTEKPANRWQARLLDVRKLNSRRFGLFHDDEPVATIVAADEMIVRRIAAAMNLTTEEQRQELAAHPAYRRRAR